MTQSPPQGSEVILLTDDEPQVRITTARILKMYGYEVMEAGSAEEALYLAHAWDFDLLLMDVVLPRMTGLSLAHKIRDIKPGTRVLFYSAYASPEILDSQWVAGPGIGFIQKPFAAADMARAVRKLLDEPLPTDTPEEKAPGGTESLLIMEEDAQIRLFMVKALERLGYHVLEASNLERAVTIALKSRVDLLITDLERPELPGPDTVEALAEAHPDLRVLFVSGREAGYQALNGDTGTLRPAILRKPFNATELGKAVRKLLDEPGSN